MVSALIRFFKYEISINSKDNISKILIETQQSNTVSDFARLFQTYQIAVFFIRGMLHFQRKVIHYVKSYILCSDLRFLCCCLLFFDVLFQDFAVLPVLVE